MDWSDELSESEEDEEGDDEEEEVIFIHAAGWCCDRFLFRLRSLRVKVYLTLRSSKIGKRESCHLLRCVCSPVVCLSCLEYMEAMFGFVIPEIERVVDMEGPLAESS